MKTKPLVLALISAGVVGTASAIDWNPVEWLHSKSPVSESSAPKVTAPMQAGNDSLPIGPINLDYGWPLRHDSFTGAGGQFSFNVGTKF